MGMRVGAGGGGAAMVQIQAAQMAQKVTSTGESAPAPKTSPMAALSAQNNQMQSVFRLKPTHEGWFLFDQNI